MAVFQAGNPVAHRIAGGTASLSNAATTVCHEAALLPRIDRENSGRPASIEQPERRLRGVAGRAEFIRQIPQRDRAHPVPLTVTRKP
jgi:hypothetical protein